MTVHEAYDLCSAFGIESLFRGQRRCLASRRKEVFWGGALGCGKSWIAAVWVVLRALENPKCTVLVVAQSAAIHKENLFPIVMSHLDAWAINQGYSLVTRVTLSLPIAVHLRNGSKILFVGQEWLQVNRGPQFAAILLEELSKASRPLELLQEAIGRLRDPRAAFRQLLVLTNLEHGLTGPTKLYLDRAKAGDTNVDVILSGTRENTTLPDDYIPSLKASMSRTMYLAMVEGQIIRPQASFFPEYSPRRHLARWEEREARGWPWVVVTDWGIQSAVIVLLVGRVSEDGRWSPDDGGAAEQPVGVTIADEVVDGELNTQDKVIAHLRRVVLPKWERLTGQSARGLVYDPAPGKVVMRAMRELARDHGCEAWHYDQGDQHEKAAAPRYERVRSWLDPADGPVRIRISEELHRRASSLERGICTSLEQLPRAMLRGEYVDGIAQGTPYEHIVDTLGMGCQYVGRTPQRIGSLSAPLTRHNQPHRMR